MRRPRRNATGRSRRPRTTTIARTAGDERGGPAARVQGRAPSHRAQGSDRAERGREAQRVDPGGADPVRARTEGDAGDAGGPEERVSESDAAAPREQQVSTAPVE